MSRSAEGFSLVGVLVAMTITLLITAAALSLALSGRHLYQTDEARTTVNQSLRGGIDLIGLDIHRAGARLPEDFPAIVLEDGAAGAPDRLILRRNLVEVVLPVCADIVAASNTTDVAIADPVGPAPAGCDPAADDDADGWPDNLEVWRDFRAAAGGEVWAYVYNPVTRAGEFFRYDTEDNVALTLHKANADPWVNGYGVGDQARVYLLEERAFDLQGEMLRCVVNDDALLALNLVGTVQDFQARVRLQDGTEQDAFAATDPWVEVAAIRVELVGERALGDRAFRRTLATEFTPRNVLSFGKWS